MKSMIKKMYEYLLPEYSPTEINEQIQDAEFKNVTKNSLTVIWATGATERLILDKSNKLKAKNK
jgi:hypothetical protein